MATPPPSLWQLVAVYALLGLALSLCGLASNMVMLTGWFDSARPRHGILLMASSLGGALFPLAVGSGIEQLGWRQTVLLTGVGVGSIMLGSVWLLLRDGTRDAGLTTPAPHRTRSSVSSQYLTLTLLRSSLPPAPVVHYHRTNPHQSIHLNVGLARSSHRVSLLFGCSWSSFCFRLHRFNLHRSWRVQYLCWSSHYLR